MKSPIQVFSNWVLNGKDEGMEKNHSASVDNMIQYSTKGLDKYKFIDAGCGNGWVVRKVSSDPKCISAIGVDGSSNMIHKAKSLDNKNDYFCFDLLGWRPKKKVDIVHSMEVLYYFKNPENVIKHIHNNWLKNGGRLIIGIDHYKENKPSHRWKQETSITIMQLLSKKMWLNFFKKVGFYKIESWYYGKDGDWNGTLIITGIK